MEKEEKMEDSLQNRVNFFHNGKYDDSITAVYQDLLCMGLSTRNVEKVINIVLKDLLAIEATQLPKTTFSNYMLFEAKLFDFKKKGHSYWTYDFNKADGTTLVSGLRSVGGGDAKTQSNTFQEILDLSNTSCLKNNSNFFRM